MPLNLPADPTANQFFPVPVAPSNVPVGNLTVNFARGTGKATVFGPLPSVLLYGGETMGRDKPFLLLDHHLKGTVAQFNGDFSLTAQQNP